jgi:3-oxoacyl-[acyl-carrier-protein] synthase III
VKRPVYICGSGAYLPGKGYSFDEIEDVLGRLADAPQKIQKWMVSTQTVLKELLAVKTFHYAFDPVSREYTDDNITMSAKAAVKALEAAGISPANVDLICYGSPHMAQMPTPSVRIQEALGIENCAELSINANCTSAYKALHTAKALVESGYNETALAISSNVASSQLRAEYYNQAVVDKESLFLRWFLCDGAGAIVVSAKPFNTAHFILEHTYMESIGGKRPSLMFDKKPAYYMNPLAEFESGAHHLRQNFRNTLPTALFQDADGSIFINGLKRMIKQAKFSIETIRFFHCNFPAYHIADSVKEECLEMGIDESAIYTGLDTQGYSGPPAALIGLDKILREEKVPENGRIVSFVTEVSKFMQAGYSIINASTNGNIGNGKNRNKLNESE